VPGPPIPEVKLRQLVRERISANAVPVMLVSEVHAAHGRDERCSVCGETIARSQIEYEVPAFRAGAFHMVCYAVWQLECAERFRSGPS